MKNIYRSLLFLGMGLSGFSLSSFSAPLQQKISSPDGNLHCLIEIFNDRLFLSVTMDAWTILERSPLLMSVDGIDITSNVKAGKIRKFKTNEIYPIYGLHAVAKNNYNGKTVSLSHTGSGLQYILEVRVFNDAIAFRFSVPGDENTIRTPDESTVFKFRPSTVWYHDLYMHYEGIHAKK
jgi:alpha-glucosidase